MIAVDGVSKSFGSFVAIEDLSFEVAAGEIVGLLGPNGAGKTTMMRILAGVFPPSRGTVHVAGYDVVKDPLRTRAAVGYFPERVSAYLDMTVSSYLRYVAKMKGFSGSAANSQAVSAMGACGIEAVANRIIGSLSKGFRQRVGIAQALTGEPSVLILDEPTSGLDPEQVADMRDLIRGLGEKRTVILSTHILPEVESTCDRVIILHRGRIVAVDTTGNLSRRIQRAGRIFVEIDAPVEDARQHLSQFAGVSSVESKPRSGDSAASFIVMTEQDRDVRAALASSIVQRGWGLVELRSVAFSLEEIFLTLTQDQEGS